MSKSTVNKGSYFLDDEARVAEFNAKRAYKNEEAYYEYRANWNNYPQMKFVSEYPLPVEFNISNVCNLQCPYCYRQMEEYKEAEENQLYGF